MMPEYVAITIKIPRKTWEIIQRSTAELQGRAGRGCRTPCSIRMCMRRRCWSRLWICRKRSRSGARAESAAT